MTSDEALYEFCMRRGVSFSSHYWSPGDHAAWEQVGAGLRREDAGHGIQ